MSSHCKSEAGLFEPSINRNKCEGKADCIKACPFNVFTVTKILPNDYQQLSWIGKIKNIAHGRKTAYTPNAKLCKACGYCITACSEKAITLKKVQT